MERIRADSRAFIDSAGLLGDRILNVSMGSPEAPQLDATLQAGSSVSFEAHRFLGQTSLANVESGPGLLHRLIYDQRNVLLKASIRFTLEEEGLRRVENAPSVEGTEAQPRESASAP